MKKSYIESSWSRKDQKLDTKLRPASLSQFVGQDKAKEKLSVFIGAARQRKEALGHCLFCGPPGLGKTTLAHVIAEEMEVNITTTSGPMLEKPADLAGILTNLAEGDILFIDEIHRLGKTVEEYLYSAMEDFKLDLIIDSGAQARSVEVKLNRFTLVGATTKMGLISSPLLTRFLLTCRLDYYDKQSLSSILERSSSLLSLDIRNDSLSEIAKRSRGTPRIANNLLRWVRDYAQMRSANKLDQVSTRNALELLDIDFLGLNEMDKSFLNFLIEKHQGGPVGINTIAAGVGEESLTLSEVHEPFLLMQGLISITPRGRVASPLAYQHLGKSMPKNSQE
ncbi:Holliday junction branch migration DNA helicase RuvB [Candidatus Aerophobetes bacterium]|uniref:Holliday junction branch migration complex subunit RuvB n=1 Tax=Aerophobetes bacterium TaxID=2030807 RepID=A0A2A4X6W4_UNCAE|nr:MAG: Holliday junction branch migration DNA helicase RuvB [Candidatus Aerophobetes bacterium]